MIEYTNFIDDYEPKFWCLNGKRYNKEGNGIKIFNGDKFWYKNDKLHREDGPAVELVGGTKLWYLDGIRHTEEKFNRKMNPESAKELTIEQISDLLGYEIKIVK